MMLEEFTFGCFASKHKGSVTIGVLYAQKQTEYFDLSDRDHGGVEYGNKRTQVSLPFDGVGTGKTGNDPVAVITCQFKQKAGAGIEIYAFFVVERKDIRTDKIRCPVDSGISPAHKRGDVEFEYRGGTADAMADFARRTQEFQRSLQSVKYSAITVDAQCATPGFCQALLTMQPVKPSSK